MTKVKTQVGFSWVAMATALLILGGCKVVSPGVAYNVVALDALMSATPEQVTDAARQVVEDMNLMLISAEATGLDGRVVATTARKKKVTVTITRQAKNISHIKIQVGKFGDEATSLLILERIKELM